MKKTFMFITTACILSALTSNAQNTFPANGNVGVGTLAPSTSLQVIGKTRMGDANNYAQIDGGGILTFKGNAAYNVGGNKYVFRYTGNPNYGLFFNNTASQYEFLDGNARPVFQVDINLGNGTFTGGVKISNSANLTAGNMRWTGTDFEGYDGSLWKSFTAAGWSLTGNAGTNPATNFLGTTDAQPLVFKVNNQRAGFLDNSSAKNTSFGTLGLAVNTTGNNNTSVGYASLAKNTTGYSNVAIGNHALNSNTDGSNMIAIGDSALYKQGFKALSAYRNIAIGSKALFNNNDGQNNVALGVEALTKNSTGIHNVAIGNFALETNFSGSFNTALGLGTLSNNTFGDNNTAIGYNAGITSQSTIYNATALGNNAIADGTNKVRIGNTSVTSIGGQVGWTNFSDARVKKDVKENVPGLKFIKALRAVTYHYNIDKENELLGKKDDTRDWDGKRDLEKINFSGFLAQEVDAAAKKIGYEFSGVDNTGKIMGLRYAEFVVPLVKAVQELSGENEDLKTKNAELEKRLQKIEDLLSGNTVAVNSASQNITSENVGTASLEQNIPNPSTGNTVIRYAVPVNAKQASLVITGLGGQTVKSYILNKGTGQLSIASGQLASGNYLYTLIVDGKKMDSKQMMIAK